MSKKFLLICGLIVLGSIVLKAGEPAVYDPRNWPSILGEYNGETKRIKATSSGELKVNASGSVDVSGSTITARDYERQISQNYVSSAITSPSSVSVSGVGLSWLVKVNGGSCVFNINGGNDIVLSDGEGIGDDFNFTNPTINVTSLSANTTAYVYIRYR